MNDARHHVLVTGASRGIGRAICHVLSNANWPTIAWARSEVDLASMAIEATGTCPIVQCVDMSDAQSIRSAIIALRNDGVRIGSLILNAGTGRWKPISEQSLEEWQRVQQVNVDGNYLLLHELLADINATPSGAIVALLSDSALYPFAERTAYAASKASLKMLLESVRQEVRAFGTRVMLLCPSRVDTYFKGSREHAEPGSRPGSMTAGDVAAVALFALSLPRHVELREIQFGSTYASYGPYENLTSR